MKHLRLALAFATLTVAPAAAEAPDWASLMAEAAWDWHPGDLIFRNGFNDLDDLIRDAEGGQWASVAMLRAASGDPRVVYVDPDQGVTEMMLDEYIAGLGDDYTVYRVTSLDPNRPGAQMQMGPMASYALFSAYGAAYDPWMLTGADGFYNAKLPYMAALNFGVVLGQPVLLEELGAASPALRDALLADWQRHPYCPVAQDADACWAEIKGIGVITPRVLMESDAVTRVFPL